MEKELRLQAQHRDFQAQLSAEQMAHNPNRSETKSTHACFTKRANCMTLSVLETSLPMQRSHDTLAFGI